MTDTSYTVHQTDHTIAQMQIQLRRYIGGDWDQRVVVAFTSTTGTQPYATYSFTPTELTEYRDMLTKFIDQLTEEKPVLQDVTDAILKNVSVDSDKMDIVAQPKH